MKTMMQATTHRRAAAVLAVWLFACAPALLAQDAEDGFVPADGLAEGWYARIETSLGRIVARLLPEQAPQSVAHFAAMAEGQLEWFDMTTGVLEKGHYYDGIKIHLADAGIRFEAGCPRGTGNHAPEIFVPPEFGPINFSKPGRLGMVRDTGRISGVMFFATSAGSPWLNKQHPCFGAVVQGRDVIDAISQVKTYPNKRPIEPPPVIEKIRIFSVGEPDPLPEPQPYYPQRPKFEQKPRP